MSQKDPILTNLENVLKGIEKSRNQRLKNQSQKSTPQKANSFMNTIQELKEHLNNPYSQENIERVRSRFKLSYESAILLISKNPEQYTISN